MLDNLKALNPAGNFEQFFMKMFGSHQGYVYCPITAPSNAAEWQPYFFKWPQDKDKLVEHVISKKEKHDIYFSPTLFKKGDLRKELVNGSKFLWTEFNGELPDAKLLEDLPEPCMKMRTSVEKHEIWFWELEFFTKFEDLEDTLKRLSFHLGADLSTWHYESVLRLPDTINHGNQVGTYLFDRTDKYSPIAAFKDLPEAPKYLSDDAYKKLPTFNHVFGKYAFPVETIMLLEKEDPLAGKKDEERTRQKLHAAYKRLAFDLAEVGMDDSEMLAVLLRVDAKWKLWSDRTPEAQRGRIIGLIRLIRKHKPQITPSLTLDYSSQVWDYFSFLTQEFNFEWLVKGLIEKQGLGMIAADSETGKTRFSISFALHLAMGRDFLAWKTERPIRVMFASLEQNAMALQLTMKTLSIDLLEVADEEKDLLRENFSLWTIGSSIHLDKQKYQILFSAFVEEHRPELIIIDSLGVAVQDDIENAKIVNTVFEYLNREIRNKYGTAIFFIHHNRKHGDKPSTKDDMFGSVYIRNQMTSIISLSRVPPTEKMMKLRVSSFKSRLSEGFKTFQCIAIWDSAKYELLGPGGSKIVNSKTTKEPAGFGKMFQDFGE